MNSRTLTDLKREDGSQKWADGGANRQDGNKPIKVCGCCGGKVVFVQSNKTGKWYLADCFPYADLSDTGRPTSYFYVKSSPHFKSCERKAKDRQDRQDNEAKLLDWWYGRTGVVD